MRFNSIEDKLLKNNTVSNPKESHDCRIWEKENWKYEWFNTDKMYSL